MRPSLPVLVLAACASLAPEACGGEAGGVPAVTRTDSAGIEIVQGPREDAPLAWRFERAFAVGGAAEGPEAFFGVSPADVAADAAGRIHVLDRGNQRVVVFDSAGRHLRTLGGEGRGPGQLARPLGLLVAPDGTVRVFDLGRGLIGFGPRGDTLPVRRLGVPFVQGMAGTPAGTVVQVPTLGERPTRTRLVRLAGADTTELTGGPLWQHEMVRYESCGVGLRLGPVFEPSFQWAAGGDRVAVVTGAEYGIELYEGVERTASVRRPLPAREATRALAAAELGEGMEVTVGGEPRTCETEEVLEKSGVADRVPRIADVAVAPDGTLWVERKVVGDGGGGPDDGGNPIDVFGPDLAYEGTLPAGPPFPDAFAGPNRIVVHEMGELDVSRFVAYDVVRGGEGEGR